MCQYRPEYGQRLEMANIIIFKIILLEVFNKLLSHERGPTKDSSLSLIFLLIKE